MSDSLLDAQIRIQKQLLWLSALWACLILLVGIAMTVYFLSESSSVNVSDLVKSGPLFISAAVTSFFPWRDYMRCRAKIATYKTLEKNFKGLNPEKQEEMLILVLTDALKETVKLG